ncbi:hypothetical protein [Chitinimonas naiadis]
MEAMKPDELDDAALSTAYRALETPSPSAALDAAILAAAREAVQPSATVLPFPARPRRNWRLPLGLAASLTLAVGLSWQLQQSGDATLDMPIAPAIQAETAPAPSPAPDTSSPEAETVAPPPPAEQAHQAALRAAPARESVPSRSADAAMPSAADRLAPLAPPAIVSPPPPAPPAPTPVAAPAPAPVAALQQAELPTPKAEPYADKPRDRISVTGSAVARPDQAAAAAPAADARRQEEGRLAKRSNLMAAPIGKLAMDPDQTIQEVRRLLATHQEPAARALLKRLREQWPDHPLPPDLLELDKHPAEPASPAP